MTTSQKRAIGYAIRDKQRNKMYKYITTHDLMDSYLKSDYRTYRGFLKNLRKQMIDSNQSTVEITNALL